MEGKGKISLRQVNKCSFTSRNTGQITTYRAQGQTPGSPLLLQEPASQSAETRSRKQDTQSARRPPQSGSSGS